MNSSIYIRVLHQEYSHASLYALRFKTHFHTEVKQIITSLFPQLSPPFEGRGVPDKRQQKHVTKVSPNTLSGLEATLLPRSESGGPGPRAQAHGSREGQALQAGAVWESAQLAFPTPPACPAADTREHVRTGARGVCVFILTPTL